MASKAELRGLVTLNNKVFLAKMRRMRRAARVWGRRMKEAGAVVAKAMAIGGTAVAATGAAIFKLTKDTAEAGNAFDKMSKRVGISAQALSEYAHVANITGTNQDVIQKGMKSMARAVSYAKDGLATYTREFDKLGVSIDEFEGKSPQEAFELILGALNTMPDELQKAATAATLFGRAGQQLLPMSKLGADGIAALRREARELGVTFDKEAAAKAARFKDELARLKASLAGVRNKVVLSFLDDFSAGIATITKKIVQMRKDGTFVRWAATAAFAVNAFVARARIAFTTIMEYGKATFMSLKDFAAIAWDGIVVVATGAAIKVIDAVANMGSRIIEALGPVAEFIQNVVLGMIRTMEEKLVKFFIKSEKLGYVEATGRAAVARDKLLESDDVQDIQKAVIEGQKTIRKAIGDVQEEAANRSAERAAKVGQRFADATAKVAEKTRKIKEQQANVDQKITNAQKAALKWEQERGKEEKKITNEQQKQKGLLAPLRGIFGGISSKLKAGLKLPAALAKRNMEAAKARDKNKVENEQLKAQKQIVENTGKKQPQPVW